MDDLSLAYVARAQSALNLLAGNSTAGPSKAKAAAFIEIAKTMIAHRQKSTALNVLRNSHTELVKKAVAEVIDANGVFAGELAQLLAASYIQSIAQFSLLDQLMRFGRTIPAALRHVLIASDSVGNSVAEGSPKPVINLGLSLGDVQPIKSTAMVVLSDELARFTGPEGAALFERELRQAVLRAVNAGVLDAFSDSGSSTVTAGSDALASLRAGLAAAGGSEGYVVAMGQADATFLATHEANRGMGPRGGEFAPGVNIVTVDGLIGMRVFPASQFAIWDNGLQIKSSDAAAIDMRASPSAPYEMTSMWQTNSTAILAERSWNIVAPADSVIFVEGA